MNIDTLEYNQQWTLQKSAIADKNLASLVLLFGDSDSIKDQQLFNSLKTLYPSAQIIGASSAGNILGAEIHNTPAVATAVQFEKGSIYTAAVEFSAGDDVKTICQKLLEQLPAEDLSHLFVLSDGLNINGSELVKYLNELTDNVSITGGMAGDGDRFQQTWTIANAPAKQCQIVAIGFYSNHFVISSGCFAGWSEFGTNHIVTKSQSNVLYELDGQPALDVYKHYLGPYAEQLPNSGMRFPLSIKKAENDPEVIRTLLAINEDEKSITFAGDVPKGYTVRLMKPVIDMLIDGAELAAKHINQVNDQTALGLVVSCTGRKIVMSDLVEDELEVIEDTLGKNIQLTGFYSYGEMAPFTDDLFSCQLHNQTMTLTGIYEK